MPFTSPFPDLHILKVNLLTYLFPRGESPSTKPLWIDSKDTSISLSPAQLLQWVKRLAFGLERVGLKRGDVVMIYTPNHIFVPVAYLGIVGAGYAFSGANPIYTLPGKCANLRHGLTDKIIEMVHQIKNTEAKLILAHPTMVKTAVEAASQAGVPKSRIFQFSDSENALKDGIEDWRHLIGTLSEGEIYSWPELSSEESMTTTATINYSSGTT